MIKRFRGKIKKAERREKKGFQSCGHFSLCVIKEKLF